MPGPDRKYFSEEAPNLHNSLALLGRGPTRRISPLNTFINIVTSSRRDRFRKRPSCPLALTMFRKNSLPPFPTTLSGTSWLWPSNRTAIKTTISTGTEIIMTLVANRTSIIRVRAELTASLPLKPKMSPDRIKSMATNVFASSPGRESKCAVHSSTNLSRYSFGDSFAAIRTRLERIRGIHAVVSFARIIISTPTIIALTMPTRHRP